ncbi:conserved hypothetical protein [Candidatus Methylobacter favarea]|uniref:Uncharacterized protein n=1 Tax=Candidatus Methylobacter favarea TaxID=2707345 RepID=A0A8S0X1F4_9GAMM|nr:hypothetical protein [Candidatus Methylobacter favarea]CAA9891198.1 conserved hypothetical protein [Candidatus Methylobacter favarea]
MTKDILAEEQQHLASLLEAIQRCAFFLDASDRKIAWPLLPDMFIQKKKDQSLFESLAAINERFAKLQDTLGAAMRHALMLQGEQAETFLKVLIFYEKIGVIDSVATWQLCRAARNLAAHDYETEYSSLAEHFNTLHELEPMLFFTAERFLERCKSNLDIGPASREFEPEFLAALRQIR